MRAATARTLTGGAVNARVVEVVEYDADNYGVFPAVAGEAAVRLQGRGGHAYIGDKSDPSQAWYGYAATNQAFVGASHQAVHSPRIHDLQGLDMSTGVVEEGPFADPTRRIFAQRLARRSAM